MLWSYSLPFREDTESITESFQSLSEDCKAKLLLFICYNTIEVFIDKRYFCRTDKKYK